jgi:hypothetical protein
VFAEIIIDASSEKMICRHSSKPQKGQFRNVVPVEYPLKPAFSWVSSSLNLSLGVSFRLFVDEEAFSCATATHSFFLFNVQDSNNLVTSSSEILRGAPLLGFLAKEGGEDLVLPFPHKLERPTFRVASSFSLGGPIKKRPDFTS